MLRLNRTGHYYWSRYRLPTQMPRFEGPAPVAAPQNMNSTKTNEFIDPIDDKFPVSIRGNVVRPNVPEDQYVDSWYVCNSMTHQLGDFRPWSASAPANAYRYRPFNEFDAKGREYVQKMTEFRVYNGKASRGKGSKGFPFRESFLTKMSSDEHPTPAVPLAAIMEREIKERLQFAKVQGPLEVQRDVGRLEAPLACAGKIKPDSSVFPFRWNTEDWYEYEVAKVRNRRFVFENGPGAALNSSEVTYKILLEGFWDHHVAKLADDVTMFLKDVGRQIVSEKLKSVRQMIDALDSGCVDPDIVAAFNSSTRGVFGGKECYSDEEVAAFVRADLELLEEQCVKVINRCNTPVPGASNIYSADVSWPFVEKLEPWVRMAEFWTSSSDTSFTELEMSTTHYEFRKFFRVVVVKMPFQSTEFEQRLYGIRHWLHRQTSCEIHTTYRRNVVHDGSVFPTEHDPLHKPTHEHHRLFSFAFDWHSAPVSLLSVETVGKGDTWEVVARRLGCAVADLKAANEAAAEEGELEEGSVLQVPALATKRLPSFGSVPRVLPLTAEGNAGGVQIKTWDEAARVLNCTVEELQQANGEAALKYKVDESGGGCFDSSTVALNVPVSVWDASAQEEFASTEPVYEMDTWEAIAARLSCTVDDLRASNEKVKNLAEVESVAVPATARTPRRLAHPQLRQQAATDSLLPRSEGEKAALKTKHIPYLPDNAAQFPHEYHTTTSRFPHTPRETSGTEDWMAYTATFLDDGFGVPAEPQPVYNVNKLWPMEQIPGKIDQTPFEEDQTWLMHPIPVQQNEQHHPEKDLQDLPFVNHEQFPRSIDWQAP